MYMYLVFAAAAAAHRAANLQLRNFAHAHTDCPDMGATAVVALESKTQFDARGRAGCMGFNGARKPPAALESATHHFVLD